MKLFVIALALFAQLAWAQEECQIEQTSQMTARHKIGPVTDLVKTPGNGQCTVEYRLNVNGEWHDVKWTHKGLYQDAVLCQMAIRNGTNQLLVELPGQFKTETKLTCKPKQKIPVGLGYEGKESEFGIDKQRQMYFKVDNISKCRMFKGHHADGVSTRLDGVICLNNNELWTIVDRF